MRVKKLRAVTKVKAKRICGIDASTQAIAFTIFYNRKPVKWGKLALEGKDIYEKSGDAAKKTAALLKAYDIDYVAIESAVFVNSIQVVKKLAYVYGAIIGAVAATGRVVNEVEPITWQSAIGNKSFTKAQRAAIMKKYPKRSKSWYSNHIRQLRKQKTIKFINDRFGTLITDDDVADAAGIAYYAYYEMTRR